MHIPCVTVTPSPYNLVSDCQLIYIEFFAPARRLCGSVGVHGASRSLGAGEVDKVVPDSYVRAKLGRGEFAASFLCPKRSLPAKLGAGSRNFSFYALVPHLPFFTQQDVPGFPSDRGGVGRVSPALGSRFKDLFRNQCEVAERPPHGLLYSPGRFRQLDG